MKNIIFFSFFIVIAAHTQQTSAQCMADELSNGCISKLTPGFNFLKAYKINGEKAVDKVEYSYVFAKGTQYMVTLCDQKVSANSIMITIFDSQRRKVANNKVDGTLLGAIAYACSATGIYYLEYSFESSTARCGGSALGFKR